MKPTEVPFFDLQRQYRLIKDEVHEKIREVCEESAFASGPFVSQFEKEFAQFLHAPYAAGVNSGTSALHLALLSLLVGPGDEVIIPSHTFIATAWAVSYVGATPVFVDSDQHTFQIDLASVEAAITKKTKAVIGVHIYGQVCDVRVLSSLCKARGLYLIEDCAQAHGALYKNKHVGTFGDVGCFSFYPSKNLGAYGEAGMVVTSSKRVYDRVVTLRNHGSTRKYEHTELGFNMRMDGMQAAVLSVKLPYLSDWNQARRSIALYYKKNLHLPSIRIQEELALSEGVYHLFVVTHPNRDALVRYLTDRGIHTAQHYPIPSHLQRAYRTLPTYKRGRLPHTEYVASHCVSLPMFPEMKRAEVQRVVESVNAYPS